MRYFKKVKQETWILLAICALYFLLRLPNLTAQPIFADEAIYIRWAQIAKAVPSLRFVSLQDGKTPLFMWLMAPFLLIFQDPLFAGRLLSVVSGLFTVLGVWMICRSCFSKKVGLIAAFLVTVTPYMFFFDRMALVDSMLAAFVTWSIYFGLKLAHMPSYKNAIILGIIMGCAWLTKTPGMVTIVMLPVYLLFFDFKKADLRKRLIKFGSFFVLAAFVAGIMYLAQKIDPNFHQLSARNSDYLHPVSRLLIYPFDPFIPHFKDTMEYFWSFFGLPLILLIPGALILPFVKKNRFAILMVIWIAIPFWYELQFVKAYTARYLLFLIPILLMLIPWEIDFLIQFSAKYFKSMMKPNYFNKLALSLILLAIAIWPIYFVTKTFSDPAKTPLPLGERIGYLEDWTAGYGFKDIAQYLQQQSQNQIVVVGTEGGFGTLPEGVWIYLDRDTNVVFKPGKDFLPDSIIQEAKNHPTYFIANRQINLSVAPNTELLNNYLKHAEPGQVPGAILFYRVKSQ
jgi:4-amino-4-deoxy-L-arabinose transferase-like glycosyltransferase